MLQDVKARLLPVGWAERHHAAGLRRQWTLSTQFLLASLVISLAGMAVIGLLVSRQIEDGVLNRTAAITALYVDSTVAPHLQALGEVRAIATGLRLPELQPLTLSDVAERAVQAHERRSGTPVQLTPGDLPEEAPLAVKTIKHYMTNILAKLHVRSRVEAALLAQKAGIGEERTGSPS
jgi:hypothetical protein